MKILFYYWGEWSANDCIESLMRLGHQVTRLSYPLKNYDNDTELENSLHKLLSSGDFDCLFSFNYFPVLSKICQDRNCIYVSWVYDSPNLTLYSNTLSNPCNRIFHFDRGACEELKAQGFSNIFHCPLGVNTIRIMNQVFQYRSIPYEHEVCFLGNLYNDSHTVYDRIQSLAPYLKGYLDGIIESSCKIWGENLLDKLLHKDILKECLSHIHFETSDAYRKHDKESLEYLLQRKITATERTALLKKLSVHLPVDLYTASDTTALPNVRNLGYCDYITEMSKNFMLSKINLNITLRSIKTGIPLRALDIMAAGGFLLSNYQAELAECFVDGEELVLYTTPDDLIEKAIFYHKNDVLRQNIAARGFEKTNQLFSYEKQLTYILSHI